MRNLLTKTFIVKLIAESKKQEGHLLQRAGGFMTK